MKPVFTEFAALICCAILGWRPDKVFWFATGLGQHAGLRFLVT